jgi:hypothetical protein
MADPGGRVRAGIVTIVTIITGTTSMRPAITSGTTGDTTGDTTDGTTTTEVDGGTASGLVGPDAVSACTYSLAWQMLLNKGRAASINAACREIRSHGRQKHHRIPY